MVEMFPGVAEKDGWIRGHGSLRGGPELLRGIGDKGPPFRRGNNILVILSGASIIKGGMCCISFAPARLAQLRSSMSWLFLYNKELTPYLGSSLQSWQDKV